MINVSTTWPSMIQILKEYKPTIYYKKIYWNFPITGNIKCNTDGASRDNLGEVLMIFV